MWYSKKRQYSSHEKSDEHEKTYMSILDISELFVYIYI